MTARSTKILNQDEQVAAAVELNSAEWVRRLASVPWVQLHDEPDVLWCFAGDTWPMNSVACARFRPTTARPRIREILAHHWEHKVACNWIVGPMSEPGDLGRHLRDNGFSCRVHCAGMACDLARLNGEAPIPDGATVKQVEELPSLVPLTTERRRRRHEGRKLIAKAQPRSIAYFSASVDGQAVGETALLLDGGGVAGIYDVEVRQEFRRRGIGSALIHAALQHARKHGLKIAVLGATGLGARIYQNAGFREVCKISFWKYGKIRQLR